MKRFVKIYTLNLIMSAEDIIKKNENPINGGSTH